MATKVLQILLFFLVSFAYTRPSNVVLDALSGRKAPLKPTDDPFYTGPPGFESKAPGTILKHRPLPAPIKLNDHDTLKVSAAYQILYRTTDSLGKPQAALTTLIIPKRPDFNKLLSYQIAYDSSYINCNPSYTLLQGSDTSDGLTTSGLETIPISAALDQGWIVNTPDYEGDKAAFVSGPQAGQATLDSVRAVLRSGSFSKVSKNAKYAMWGYSGGCLASGWASELQPSYAKELNFIGVACGGLVPNVTSILYAVNGTTEASLAASGTMGLAQGYPNFARAVNKELVPATAATFKSVLTTCELKNSATFNNQNMFKYFKSGQAFLSKPVSKSVLRVAGQQGLRDVPKMPLYYYKSAGDTLSPIRDTDALYDKFCKGGANIYYARDALGSHGLEAILGLPAAFGWLQDRFNGLPTAKGCHKELLAISELSPDSIEALGPVVYTALKDALGDPDFLPKKRI